MLLLIVNAGGMKREFLKCMNVFVDISKSDSDILCIVSKRLRKNL